MPDDLRLALRRSLEGVAGLVPLGVAFGMLVLQAGLPWWMAPLLSVVVYAGSMELLLVGFLAAGTPALTVVLTTLLVNFRHVFYGIGFPLREIRSPVAKLYAVYALTDETYAILHGHRGGWSGRGVVALQAALQLAWVGGGLAGVALAGVLPAPIEGLEFALVALFVVLALDAAKARESRPSVALGAAALGLGLLLVPAQPLLAALVGFSVALLGRHALGRRRNDG